MTPRSLVFLAAAAFLSTTAHAQNPPPDQWCQNNYGPGYTAKYEPDGSFIGECIAPPVTICTGNMYIHPKTGAGLCCDVAGTVMKVDTGYNEAECCQPTQIFKWNPSTRTGACAAPPPIIVPTTISCPGSHFATISRGGRNWRIYCNHNVKEWVPPLQKIRGIATLISGNAPSTGDDVNSCLNKCIADPNCNGANLWQKQSNCSLQNKGKQGSIFSSGDLYLAVPPVALLNKPVIAIVAIPRRV